MKKILLILIILVGILGVSCTDTSLVDDALFDIDSPVHKNKNWRIKKELNFETGSNSGYATDDNVTVETRD